MINSLTQYFALNGHLVLPNIGMIKLHKEDAKWVNSILFAPKETIIFEPIDSKPSKLFYHFLGETLDISFEQAIFQYEQYINEVFQNDLPHFELGNFGSLQKIEGEYHWISNFHSSAYFKEIEIAPITHQDDAVPKNTTKKENWYLWSIVLALLSIVLILFKFL